MSERYDVDQISSTIETIEGWFYRDAAGALADLLVDVVSGLPADVAVVEIGSFHGRSAALIAGVLKALAPGRRVVADDLLRAPELEKVAHAGGLVAVRRSSGPAGRP